MRCDEIMKTNVEIVREEDSVFRASEKMRDANIGFLPVCDDDGRVIGTLTDRDIVIRVCAEDRLPSAVLVTDVMTREIVACHADDDIREAEEAMATHHKSRVMVVDDDGKVVGVISLSDIADHEDLEQTGETMRQVVSREVRHY